jgi:tetratricopeptide (TPR) repeat protein
MTSRQSKKISHSNTHPTTPTELPPLKLGGRPWLFRVIAGIFIPLLFFASLEIGLNLGGYGYPTNFYLGPDANRKYETNPKFSWRYFPPSLARTPIPGFISMKPKGTIRIFILGDSAAQGFPDHKFGFGQILRVMLQERFPTFQFEIINAAMTAINSHTTRSIAQDCAKHQPDLFLVYMGNNEVIGPFGPGTVFQAWIPNLKIIRMNLWLKSTRTGQLLSSILQSIRPGKDAPVWQGMEMFLRNPITIEDPRLQTVNENLRQNIQDICDAGRKSGAAVILSTVSINLKDCPPFASKHRANIPETILKKWEALYKIGKSLETRGLRHEALGYYDQAAQLDNYFAELRFRMARCLESEGRIEEARKHFQAACDLDVLRFRADSKINQTIRQVASASGSGPIYWVDAEKELAADNVHSQGIAGSNIFYEHVHFNFNGNYRLARLLLDRIEAALPQLRGASKTKAVLAQQECATLLAMTPADESDMATTMAETMSRPPFTNQLDNNQRVAELRKLAERGTVIAAMPEAYQNGCKAYEAAIQKSPQDWILHRRFGKFLLKGGDSRKAVLHLEIASRLYPGEPLFYDDLGFAYFLNNRFSDATASFRKAIAMSPQYARAHSNLALALANQKQFPEALAEYKKSLQLDPKFFEAYVNYAGLLSKLGRHEDSIVEYRKAIPINPQDATAHYGLAMTLVDSGKISEGIAEYREALKNNPRLSEGHVNLGSILAGQGQIDEALYHFRKAVEVNPKDAMAYYCIGKALVLKAQFEEAIRSYQRALEIQPDYADANRDLQLLLTNISKVNSN